MMGTLAYMAPEQALNAKGVDRRADIYSLGCTLHFLLTGRMVYAGETVAQKFSRQSGQPVPSLREHCPEVPPALDVLFQKMIATNPDHRQQSMAEVITDLELCCDRSAKRAGSPAARSPAAAGGAATPTAHQQAAEPTVPLQPLAGLLDELLLEQPVAVVERLSLSSSRLPWPKARMRRIAARAAVAGGVLVAIILTVALLRTFTGPTGPPVPNTNTTQK
jgi:serine/threonine protein kinase